MSLSLSIDGPGDAELISAVRGGDVDAYGELFARHVDAARRLARQLAGPADADDLVSDAFTKVLTVLQRGGGPDLAFRAYLLTAVRRLHVDKIRAGARLKSVDDLTPFDPGLPFQDTAVEGFDNAAAARAFASLPERWQMVLWHTEVEQQKPADIALLLGMSANSVSALAYRAREGLRQAFLSQHATDPDDVDCSWTRDHMGAYIRGGLSRRDAKRVDDHLADCPACAAVYLELTEVNSGLAGLLAPLLLGAAGAKYASGLGGGAVAGGAGTGGFAGFQAFVAAHAGLTVIGGLAVTATALAAVYGATHLRGHDAADVGAPNQTTVPSATSTQSPGSDATGPTSSRGATGTTGTTTDAPSDAGSSPVATGTAAPSDGSSADPALTPPSGSTDASTSTDPSSTPTDTTGPTDPGVDDVTFTSDPPTDPTFGSTYRVQATSASGKPVTFSVGPTPANACSIDGDLVSFQHAGTCVITGTVSAKSAARSGGAGAAAGPTSKVFQQTVVIPKAKQQIDFHLGDGAQVDGDLPLKAQGGASPKDVTFTSDTPAVCSVNDPGTKVAFHHARTCTVTAHQDGSEDYKPADDVTRNVDVAKGDQHIDFKLRNTAQVGDTLPLTATGGPTDNTVTYKGNAACDVDDAGTTVTMVHTTGCTVTAHLDGNDDYKDASSAESVDVTPGDQTVTFPPVDRGKVGTDTDLQATSSAGINVRYSSDDAACAVTGSTVTFVHATSCVITATAGNADWNPASDQQTIAIDKGDQTIDFAPVSGGQVGTEATLRASSSAGLDVTFSTDDAFCTVTGSTVTYDHARPCLITATAGNADWNTATTDQTVDVAKGDQTITFTAVTGGKVGTSTTLHATSSAGLDVTFGTNDASCTVLGSTVSFAHAVPCVVTAKQAGNDDWNGTTTDQTIEITKGDQTIDFTPVTGAKVGTGSPLHATTNAGLDVTFSSTSDACTVTGTTVRFTHAGPCSITATQTGNADWNAASTDQTVTVGKGAPRLTVTVPGKATVGGADTVTATSDSDGAITFSLGDATTNGACTVTPDGAVTYLHAGACAITADQAESADFGAATASASFVVGKAEQHITFQLPAKATVGDTLPLTATGGASGNPVTFTGNAACVVNPAGTEVRLAHAGTCTVTAHQAGNDDYNAAPDVSQSVVVAKAEQHITFQLPAKATVGDTLPLTATGGASGNPVTFTGNAACVVNPAGTEVRLAHAGTCTVTAHQAGNDDYNAAPDVTQSVAVAKGDQKITFTAPAKATVGGSDTLTASSTSGLPVAFSTSTPGACTFSGATVTYNHAVSCTLVAKQTGNADYNAAPDVSQTVSVAKGDQKITFTSTPPSPAYVGTTYRVSATGGGSGNVVTVGSATPAVCGVKDSTVTFLAAGSCTVTANQAGNDDYAAATTATQTFTVSPAIDMSITAEVSDDPPLPNHVWHEVDVTIHDLAAGGTATVSGDSPTDGVVVVPQFNCLFQVGGICHVTSPPTTTTVKFYVLLPASRHDAKVTFTARTDDSPDPITSNDTVTVTVKRFED